MDALLLKAMPYLENAPHYLMILVVGATLIAKITPTPKDNKIVSKVASVILKVIKFLPTFGINPNTKKLEEVHKKLKDDSDS